MHFLQIPFPLRTVSMASSQPSTSQGPNAGSIPPELPVSVANDLVQDAVGATAITSLTSILGEGGPPQDLGVAEITGPVAGAPGLGMDNTESGDDAGNRLVEPSGGLIGGTLGGGAGDGGGAPIVTGSNSDTDPTPVTHLMPTSGSTIGGSGTPGMGRNEQGLGLGISATTGGRPFDHSTPMLLRSSGVSHRCHHVIRKARAGSSAKTLRSPRSGVADDPPRHHGGAVIKRTASGGSADAWA